MNWTILTAVTLIGSLTTASQWNYNDFSAWPGVCTSGTHQSPIDINFQLDLQRTLEFTKYNKRLPKDSWLTNNGHSLQMNPGKFKPRRIPIVEVVQASGTQTIIEAYKFAQLHFHWGETNKEGSEHKIQGTSYPLEMHIVHYKHCYDNLTSAVNSNKYDALLVIAVLFELMDNDDSQSSGKRPPGLNKIIESMLEDHALVYGEIRDVKPFALNTIMPRDRSSFYYYPGSLTTPNCNEVVQWFVLENKLAVHENDLVAFRELKSADGNFLSHNNRPIQNRPDLTDSNEEP